MLRGRSKRISPSPSGSYCDLTQPSRVPPWPDPPLHARRRRALRHRVEYRASIEMVVKRPAASVEDSNIDAITGAMTLVHGLLKPIGELVEFLQGVREQFARGSPCADIARLDRSE